MNTSMLFTIRYRIRPPINKTYIGYISILGYHGFACYYGTLYNSHTKVKNQKFTQLSTIS